MLSFLIMKLLQINLVSQNIVGSEVKDSYEYEFFNNAYACSHIEIIIKSCKWIDKLALVLKKTSINPMTIRIPM